MNPFKLAEKVVEDYRRYIATTFPVADPNLLEQIRKLIVEKDLLYKGPFITLTRPPKKGKTLSQLAQEGVIHEETAQIFKRLIGENPLYVHQEETLRAALRGESVLLTTGTGTGKTEAFLLPIIDYIIRYRKEGCIALLVYPMNALINDQMDRLRKLLRGTGITFAKYTRETEENPPQVRGDVPEEEILSRNEIRASPPNLLLTNYVMLELMLVRREDRPIFRHMNLRFLVMDEVHAYRGSQGAEIAGLLRRVREHTGTLDKSRLVCIGTSATVAGGREREALSFISKFFGSEFDRIVSETYDPWPQPDPEFPPPPHLKKEELEVFHPFHLARKLVGKDVTDILELGRILDKNPVIYFLRTSLEKPKTLDELVEKFRKIPSRNNVSKEEALLELTAYLLLGVEAKDREGRPLLRPKLHIFAKGLENIQICSNCRKILIHGENRCPECESLAYPLALCRNCGQDFLMASNEDGALVPPEDQRPEGKTYILQRLAEAEDEEVESRLSKWREAMFCPKHGGVYYLSNSSGNSSGDYCPECGESQKLIPVRVYPDKIMVCPACGGTYRPQPVVTTLRSQVASQVAILTTTLLTHLEPEAKRLLIFSDNRQDTALQASITEKRYRNIAIASSIYRILKEGEEDLHENGLPKKVAERLLELGVESPDEYRTEPARRRLKTQVMREVIHLLSRPPKRMGIAEDLGIVRVEYPDLEQRLMRYLDNIQSVILLPKEKILLITRGLLDIMRISGSIWYPEVFDEEVRRDIIGWGYESEEGRIQGKDLFLKVKPFVSQHGYTSLTDYVKRVLGSDFKRDEINRLVRVLTDVLKKEDYLVTKEIPLRRGRVKANFLNYEFISLKASEGGWRCSACGRFHSRELPACTKWQCTGKLIYQNIDKENYYINYLRNYEPIRVKAKEHSGQLDGIEREKIEKDFKNGKVNTIVCTPTLELGIDIGDLQSILMRNLPPSPSNYAQRSGRAGRRERIALIVAHATSRPHDQYFYDRPTHLISGEITPPPLNLDNPYIIRKHVRALILEKLQSAPPRWLREVFPIDKRTEEISMEPHGLEQCFRELRERKEEIKKAIRNAFKGEDFEWMSDSWLDEIIESFPQDLKEALMIWRDKVERVVEELKALQRISLTDEERRRRRFLEDAFKYLTEDQEAGHTLTHLMSVGFIPRYAFPGVQAELELPDRPAPIVRDAAIAIYEFAPGNIVYARGNRYVVTHISIQHLNTEMRKGKNIWNMRYIYCPECDYAVEEGALNRCPICGHEVQVSKYLPVKGFRAQYKQGINPDEEYRTANDYDRHWHVMESKETEIHSVYEIGDIAYMVIKRTPILITNRGLITERGTTEPFRICPKCGAYVTTARAAEHERRCGTTQEEIESFHLLHKYTSDLVEISVSYLKWLDHKWKASVLAAIARGAQIALEIEEEELAEFWARDAIYIAERVEGGAGYSELIAKNFKEVIKASLERLESCECPESCYRCLRTYRNQRWHKWLNRHLVIPWMKSILDAPLLVSDEAARKERRLTPPEELGLDSRFEAAFLEEVIKKYDLPLPRFQYLIENSEGIPIARADFAYPDGKIAIFIDGYTFHSRKTAWERDLRQRRELQILGWKVISFSFSEVTGNPGQCAETLRKLLKEK